MATSDTRTMSSFSVVRLSDLHPVPRLEVARLFVEAYQHDLPLCKTPQRQERWACALASSFVPEQVYVAVEDGEVLGMAACSFGAHRAIHLQARDMRRHLGLLRGTILHAIMGPMFRKKLPWPDSTEYIEAVATAERARGRGVASAILERLHSLPFEASMLDVGDANVGAKRLYERLGYREAYRERAMPGSKYRELIYMRRPRSR